MAAGESDAPAEDAATVTAADSIMARPTRGIYVGSTGDLKVTMLDGGVVTFVGIAAGVIHPIRAKQIWATGTTAGSIIGVY